MERLEGSVSCFFKQKTCFVACLAGRGAARAERGGADGADEGAVPPLHQPERGHSAVWHDHPLPQERQHQSRETRGRRTR